MSVAEASDTDNMQVKINLVDKQQTENGEYDPLVNYKWLVMIFKIMYLHFFSNQYSSFITFLD